ncbi:MAG: YceI family protein [Saprospirales bacterium]|jgi:polyisoprenoid-binding protein YceI|nr:YceI family protein [Saprospirales bacterium]MBK8920614.1 YceI family protein [Saprospirales bacterium]
MQKRTILAAFLLAFGLTAQAQRFFTRDAKVQFNSETPLEKIEAVNKSGTAVFDAKTGQMEWKVLIKSFLFERALMQEHFNENYMESNRYPSATFKGALMQPADMDYKIPSVNKVRVKGALTIHGVSKDIEVPGTITIGESTLTFQSTFTLSPADFGIDIPGVVRDKIAKTIVVKVNATLSPMNK